MKVEKEEVKTKCKAVKNQVISFASGLNIYKVFWVFLLGCFIGDIYEVLLHFIKHGEIVTRQGVLYGPFNPVYGFGAVIFELAFYRVKNLKIVFLASALLGGAFEYLCSFWQEKIFGTVSWDYSNHFMNFQGRTSLYVACFWGLCGVAFVMWFIPLFDKYIEKIPNKIGVPLSWILAIFMIVNMLLSAIAVYRYTERNQGIPAGNEVVEVIDKLYPDERVTRSYPNMMFLDENKEPIMEN